MKKKVIFSNKHIHLCQFSNSILQNGYKHNWSGLTNTWEEMEKRNEPVMYIDYISMCLMNLRNARALQT
jgi:hypothetical protein